MNLLVALTCCFAIVTSAVLIVRVFDAGARVVAAAAVLCVFVASAVLQISSSVTDVVQATGVPRAVEGRGFTTSDACRKCHPGHYESWHDSYHRTMTQLVTPETVEAPFDGQPMQFDGATWTFLRDGDRFLVRMPDPQVTGMVHPSMVPTVELPVVMSTGSHHLQVYWVDSGDHVREVPLYWHIDGQRWMPKNDSTLNPPGQPNFSQIWNVKCIRCHSVGGIPGADMANRRMSSLVAEFGISCEACHGPAEDHVRFHNNPLNRYEKHFDGEPDPTIINPRRCDPVVSSQICGQCHLEFDPVDERRFLTGGLPYRAGRDLSVSHQVFTWDLVKAARDESSTKWHYGRYGYWQDGTSRSGGDEYLGLIASPCYEHGEGSRKLGCLSCHQMHGSDPNDQLSASMTGNDACLQCHDGFREAEQLASHTHHAAGSGGSLCYNCHMPHTTYALFTAMRSHRVVTPSVANTVESGRPNACNLCHIDQSLDWTSRYLSEWYGTAETELSADQREYPAAVHSLLSGDAAQRLMGAWHLGWNEAHVAAGNSWQAPLLAELLVDPYAVVRQNAFQSLAKLPGFESFDYDYLGPESNRQAARDRARTIWQASGSAISRSGSLSRVFDANDSSLKDVIEALQAERDDAIVYIPE